MPSHRIRDTQVEKEISIFLDKYFYSKAANNHQRFFDRATQFAGIDCITSFSKLNLLDIKIDEKAATHYINKGLPTFAFEIDFIDKNQNNYIGWLFDERKQTDYYLLIWVTAKKDWNISCNDIITLECILISRNNIIKQLLDKGLTKNELLNKAELIRSSFKENTRIKSIDASFYFYYTYNLVEKPVNIILKKELLKNLSSFHIMVSKEKIWLPK